MISTLEYIAAFVMIFIFLPVQVLVATVIWKEMHGDENWGLRMWARYFMKEVPLSSEEDIINLLKRNILE